MYIAMPGELRNVIPTFVRCNILQRMKFRYAYYEYCNRFRKLKSYRIAHQMRLAIWKSPNIRSFMNRGIGAVMLPL